MRADYFAGLRSLFDEYRRARYRGEPAMLGEQLRQRQAECGDMTIDVYRTNIARRAANWFTGSLNGWTYTPLREAARAADEIVRQVLKRHPAP